MPRYIVISLVAATIGTLYVKLGDKAVAPGGYPFVSSANAIVGRPLTPVSVAGVARRTARRCAAGVYYC